MNYKLSHYIVTTDAIEEKSPKRILFSTRTAKALTVTENLYNKLQNKDWDKISAETFALLTDSKVIVPEKEDELLSIINKNKEVIKESTSLYYVIQPTAMCQLGCGYCGQKHTKDYLTKSSSDKILERIENKLKAKPFTSLSIAWFGSEPLMALSQIRELSPKLIQLAEKYSCSYDAKVITNALSLKPGIFTELATKHKVKKIEVTLDGTQEYHDKRRHTKEGISTFNLIFENLLNIYNLPNFKDLGCPLSLRCNVDIRNYQGVKPLLELLAGHNLQDKIAFFYVAPIHSWGNDAHLLSLTHQEFADLEIDWLMEQYKLGFKPGLLPGLTHEVCLSVNPDAEVIDAFGNVFDCTEVPFVPVYENSEYKQGNINDAPEMFKKKSSLLHFNDTVLSGTLPCSTCEMLPVCGGSCPKSWKEDIAPCPMNKYNIKDKLKLKYAFNKSGKEQVISLMEEVYN